MELLMADDVEKWESGKVPYFERVIRCNLSRAERILRVLRFHTHDLNLKSSIACYHQRKGRHPLRFSKSGEHLLEEAYSWHFVAVGSALFTAQTVQSITCTPVGLIRET